MSFFACYCNYLLVLTVMLTWSIYIWADFLNHTLILSQYVLILLLHNLFHSKWKSRSEETCHQQQALYLQVLVRYSAYLSSQNVTWPMPSFYKIFRHPDLTLSSKVYHNGAYAHISLDFDPVPCLGNIYICWKSVIIGCLSGCAEYCCEVLDIFTIVTFFSHASPLTPCRITAGRDKRFHITSSSHCMFCLKTCKSSQ